VNQRKVYELRQWAQLVHEPIIIKHIHLLQILQFMYNKLWEKITAVITILTNNIHSELK
jgi:hypothetical protein